jgi:hypothetical protein
MASPMRSGSPTRTALAVVALVVALGGIGVFAWIAATDQPDVMLVGDSIMRQTGPALTSALPDHELDNRGVNGSGLLNPGVYDWVDRLPGLLAQNTPEATVVLFIGNYAKEPGWWIGPDGQPVPPNTSAFFDEWRAQSEVVVGMLEDAGTDIYWVLPPPVASDVGNQTINGLREVYRDLAEDHPSITLVDAAPTLTNGTGSFVWSVTRGDGKEIQLRTGDGVHLAPGGAQRLARAIAEKVSAGTPS